MIKPIIKFRDWILIDKIDWNHIIFNRNPNAIDIIIFKKIIIS